MVSLRKLALSLGATDFGESRREGKRFYVIYGGEIIHFGSEGKAYVDHHDKEKRDAWYARHSVIKNKDGQNVIKVKTSPSYWSANVLWPLDDIN